MTTRAPASSSGRNGYLLTSRPGGWRKPFGSLFHGCACCLDFYAFMVATLTIELDRPTKMIRVRPRCGFSVAGDG